MFLLWIIPWVTVGLLIALMRAIREANAEKEKRFLADVCIANLLKAANSGQAFFGCPVCGRVSYNVNDVANGYCGACHEYTGLPRPTVMPQVTGQHLHA